MFVCWIPAVFVHSIFSENFLLLSFFMIGHCLGVKKKSLKDYGLSFNKSIFVLASALLGCIYIVGYKSYSFESLLYGSYCYDITDGLIFNGRGNCLIVRILILLCGCLLSLAFLSPLRYIKAPQWIVRVGELSLFFYIYHIFAVGVLGLLIGIIELPLSPLFILVYSIVLFLILYVLSGSKFMVKLLNPITIFKKNEKSLSGRWSQWYWT